MEGDKEEEVEAERRKLNLATKKNCSYAHRAPKNEFLKKKH